MDEECIDSWHYKGDGERHEYRTLLPEDSEPRWWHFTLLGAENVIMRIGHTVSNKTIMYEPGGFLTYQNAGDPIQYVKNLGLLAAAELGGVSGFAHQTYVVRRLSVYGVNFLVETVRATDTSHEFVENNMTIKEPFIEYSLSASNSGRPAFDAESSLLYYNNHDGDPETDLFRGNLIVRVPRLANRMKVSGWQRRNEPFEVNVDDITESTVKAMVMVHAKPSFTQEQFDNIITDDLVNNFDSQLFISDQAYRINRRIGFQDADALGLGRYFEQLSQVNEVTPNEHIWAYVGVDRGPGNDWESPTRRTAKHVRLLWSYQPEREVA